MKAGVGAVVVAAGRSTRLGAALPKPYQRAGGLTLLERAVGAFARARAVRAVVVVVAAERVARAKRLVGRLPKVVAVVAGGKRRQDSVRAGVAALPGGIDTVLVHDAARPLVTERLIEAVARAAVRHGAAIAAEPVSDTIKEVCGGRVVRTVDRSALWRAETPQGVRRSWLERALADPADATDEAALLERAGRPVRVVASGDPNLKVTTARDLRLVRAILGGERHR